MYVSWLRECKSLYEEALQDLNNILFQLFRKPPERLAQLMEAEKYLVDKINYFKSFESDSRYFFPFNPQLIESLTEKLTDIKFEIQQIKESLPDEKVKIENRTNTDQGLPTDRDSD